jgi:hypothetical protein
MKQRGSGMGYGRGSRGAGRGNNLQGNCPYMDGDEN